MIRSLWTGATGMRTQQTNIDVIANNLANVNTSGFKKSRADFQELLYQISRTPGSATSADTVSPTGIQVGLGSRTAAVQKIFGIGDLMHTGNDLDVAIEGRGFFQVDMPDGTTAYTRAGALKKDGDGRLTTSEGYVLEPQIVIPENTTSISIAQDGSVDVFLDGETTPNQIGIIELAMFSNEAGLRSLGRNLYNETDSSGAPIIGIPTENGFGSLAQEFLEGSNVSVMEEMVNMIAGQRAYEVNSKSVKTSDEMLQMTNNLL
ncbi:MAG: flagellar basal-body rod protein FlgG [Desulfuromonadaceae bacterium]|nr:flagellar basal-body rod protein FlgG [Desulfuromonas sp.]MDY0185012.1 flagellar basal-body rod protein FlgG [Desulfuromonadaceae bacterium]